MKTCRSPDSKPVKASGKCSLKLGSIGVKNSTKRTNMSKHKSTGCAKKLLDDKENDLLLFKDPVRQCPELLSKDAFFMEKREALEFHPGQMLASSAKIKLQLFPINKETRIGLQKDGHNPYLELTLKGQKKISSVLKHLVKKWGSSRVVKGDPMLFPYDIMENLSDCRRWTINDSGTTAASVYASVGSPAIFRLRYGWFHIHETRSFGIPSTLIPYEPGVQSRGTEGGCNANLEILYDEQDKVEVISKECKVIDVDDAANEVMAQKIDNASGAPLDNDPRIGSSLQQPTFSWIDSLTNISIGGLLSEASLQGKFSSLDPKSSDSKSGKQLVGPSQIISDSLDAFIATQLNNPPVSRLSAEDLRTSILDAEETCHAFPLGKLSSTAVDMQLVSGNKYPVSSVPGVFPNSKLPNIDKVNEDRLSQNPPFGKSWTDLLLSTRSNDGESSLGLTGIKWNESLGPFDLGMPAKQFMSGDNSSIGGFVKS